MKNVLAPSILSADFKVLGEQLKVTEAAGAEYIHFDVMDGIFVPSISFGMPVLSCIKGYTSQILDAHLMITEPIRYVEEFAKAGADIIMLDNMTPEVMKQAVELIDGRAQTECSGNITKENIQKIREIGVDFVSSGALTHSAPILDISMKNLHAI